MSKRWLLIFLLLFAFFAKDCWAAFEFSLAEGYRTIDFGAMELNEEETIAARGGYEHQFNCTSDQGRTWHFKAQLIRPFTSGTQTIPAENLQWVVERVGAGRGFVSTSLSTPSPFSTSPASIYTSADTDNTGTEVQIRLRYKLRIPQTQAAGTYTAHIRFIMVEEL
ncbi:hypothetical protein ACFL2I_02180 [Candidatus Omnitrophota bacterium]